jgi:hypothetical protein
MRLANWDFGRALPNIPPSTTHEADALQELDALRADELRALRRPSSRKQVRL